MNRVRNVFSKLIICVLLLFSFCTVRAHSPAYEKGFNVGASNYIKDNIGLELDVNYHNTLFNAGFSNSFMDGIKPKYQIFAGIGAYYFSEIQIGYDFDSFLIRFRFDYYPFAKWDGSVEQWFEKFNINLKIDKKFNSTPWIFKVGVGYLI